MRRLMRNRVSPSLNGYVLSPFGSIDGFGDFGDNPSVIITGVSDNKLMFQRNWSGEDFLNADKTKGWWAHITYWKIPGYDNWEGPPDENVMGRAAGNIARIKEGIAANSSIAQAMGNQFLSPIADAIKACDANTANYDWVKVMPGDGYHTQRVNSFNALKKAINAVANAKVPALWPDLGGGTTDVVTGAAAVGVSAANTQIALLQQQQRQQAAQAAKDAADAAAKAAAELAAAKAKATSSTGSGATAAGASKTPLIIAGAVGLVALLGAGVILSKKKKVA